MQCPVGFQQQPFRVPESSAWSAGCAAMPDAADDYRRRTSPRTKLCHVRHISGNRCGGAGMVGQWQPFTPISARPVATRAIMPIARRGNGGQRKRRSAAVANGSLPFLLLSIIWGRMKLSLVQVDPIKSRKAARRANVARGRVILNRQIRRP